MKALVAGIILGLSALAIAPHIHAKHNADWPIPLCPPDQPSCPLDQ